MIWSLILLASCGPPKDAKAPTGDDELVNETGYLNPDALWLTAAAPLSAQATEVHVIGLPGALSQPTGVLELGDDAVAPNADGSFLLSTDARLNDTLTLRYANDDGEQEVMLALDSPLEGTAPSTPDGDGPVYWVEPDGDALVVHLDLLEKLPEFIVFNLDTGHSALGYSGDLPLPGGLDDEVCVAAADSAVLCAVVITPP